MACIDLHTNEHGIIVTPGQFYGLPQYAAYYAGLARQLIAKGQAARVMVEQPERDAWPALEGIKSVVIRKVDGRYRITEETG